MSYLELIFNLTNYKNNIKITDFLSYNTKGGKSFRQKLFTNLIKDSTDGSLLFSYFLEILHGSFLVIDDIMDNSDFRRGQVCYYKKQGMISLRYSRYFLSIISKLIRTLNNIENNENENIINQKENLINQKDNLINQKEYLINNILSKYYNTLFLTSLGQTLDSYKNKEYTEFLYHKISEYKTSVYTFYFPISISYLFNRKEEPDKLYLFCKLLGIIFQMKDDLLNFNTKISKKSGNDLEERKLTYFTSRMYKEKDNKIYNEYFTKGIINQKLIEEIYLLIPEYKIKINELKKEAEKINIKLYNKISISN